MLATINTVDFIYTCDAHLTDPGFAALVDGSADSGATRKPEISAEEIAKLKEEWEEKQKRKAEKEKAEKEKEKDQEKDSEKKENREVSKSPKIPGSLSPPTPQTPPATHQRYTLHRDMFSS